MQFLQTIPTLRIFSEEKAREYYLDYLGMKLDSEHRFEPNAPIFMQVSRGDLVLHLSEHYGDGVPGTVVFVRMQGIEEFCDELTSKQYKYYRPAVEPAPWGGKMLNLIDPFGNRFRFCEAEA